MKLECNKKKESLSLCINQVQTIDISKEQKFILQN